MRQRNSNLNCVEDPALNLHQLQENVREIGLLPIVASAKSVEFRCSCGRDAAVSALRHLDEFEELCSANGRPAGQGRYFPPARH